MQTELIEKVKVSDSLYVFNSPTFVVGEVVGVPGSQGVIQRVLWSFGIFQRGIDNTFL